MAPVYQRFELPHMLRQPSYSSAFYTIAPLLAIATVLVIRRYRNASLQPRFGDAQTEKTSIQPNDDQSLSNTNAAWEKRREETTGTSKPVHELPIPCEHPPSTARQCGMKQPSLEDQYIGTRPPLHPCSHTPPIQAKFEDHTGLHPTESWRPTVKEWSNTYTTSGIPTQYGIENPRPLQHPWQLNHPQRQRKSVQTFQGVGYNKGKTLKRKIIEYR